MGLSEHLVQQRKIIQNGDGQTGVGSPRSEARVRWASEKSLVKVASDTPKLAKVSTRDFGTQADFGYQGSRPSPEKMMANGRQLGTGKMDIWHSKDWIVEPEILPGRKVRIHGLRVHTEYNDMFGCVEGWEPSKSRWRVRLSTGITKDFLPENL